MLHTHSIYSLPIRSGGHVSRFGIDVVVRLQIELCVIKVAVQSFVMIGWVFGFGFQTVQYVDWISHGVSHTVSFSILIDDRQTGPLRHVDGFPALGLLWGLRYHAGFSASSFSGC